MAAFHNEAISVIEKTDVSILSTYERQLITTSGK